MKFLTIKKAYKHSEEIGCMVTYDRYFFNVNGKEVEAVPHNAKLFFNAEEISLAINEQIEGSSNSAFFDNFFKNFFKGFSSKDGHIEITKLPEILKKIDSDKKINRGTIYLISDGEFVKIGATTYNVQKRRNELQTGNPRPLTVLGTYETKNRFLQEQRVHERFSEKNVLGEWFDLSKDDVESILKDGDDNYHEGVTFNFSKEHEYVINLADYWSVKEAREILDGIHEEEMDILISSHLLLDKEDESNYYYKFDNSHDFLRNFIDKYGEKINALIGENANSFTKQLSDLNDIQKEIIGLIDLEKNCALKISNIKKSINDSFSLSDYAEYVA